MWLLVLVTCWLFMGADGATLGKTTGGSQSGRSESRGLFDVLAENPGAAQRAIDMILEVHGLTRDQVDLDLLPNSGSPDSYISCEECTSVFGAVRLGLSLGMTFETMRPIAMIVCGQVLDPVQAPIMCDGVIDVFGPHVVEVAEHASDNTLDMCKFLHSCPRLLPNVTFDLQDRNQKPHPVQVERRAFRDPTQGTLRLAHLSDIHVDEKYLTDQIVDCGLPVCCRPYWNITGGSRPWGEYSCNTPPRTVDLILQKVAELEPDIVAYTGDSAPHSVWEETLEIQIEANRFVALAIDRNIPGIPAYSCIGNHETYPTNLYYRPRPEIEALNVEFGSMWEELSGFGQEQIDSIMKAAYYSVLARPGLRVISYNSNYGEKNNWYNVLNKDNQDFAEMVEFLDAALLEAEINNEKVILLGHHPSVGTIWEFGWAIHDLSVRYGDIIALHLTGHYHSDEINLTVDDETGEARCVQNAGISLDPGPNPGFKIFYLDPETFEVVDFDHYNLNILTAAGDGPEMEFHYRASEEYDLPDLSPASWLEMTYRMEEDDDLFQRFRRNIKGRRENWTPCTGGCKNSALCSMRSTTGDRNQHCRDGL